MSASAPPRSVASVLYLSVTFLLVFQDPKTNDNPALDIGFERTRNFVTEEAGERRKDKEETRPLSTVKMLVNLLRMMVLIGLLSGLSMTRDKLETGIRTRDTAMRFQERESLTLQVVVIVVLGS